MTFGCLLAVESIPKARAFYEEVLGLTLSADFGRNIAFTCGLSLQEDFDWLTGIAKADMKTKENNCELYFDAPDFDDFCARLKARPDVKLLHDSREYPWGQRVIRFYDLDDHLIEVGEPIKAVIDRFAAAGMSLADMAAHMDVTVQDIENMLQA